MQNENNLRLYQTPSNLSVKRIDAAWKLLEHHEHEFLTSLSNVRLSLAKKEALAQRYLLKAAKMEEWLTESEAIYRKIYANFHGRELPSDTHVPISSLLKMADAFLLSVDTKWGEFEEFERRLRELQQCHYHQVFVCEQRFEGVQSRMTQLRDLTRNELPSLMDLLKEYGDLCQQMEQQSMQLLHLSVILTTKTKGELILEQGDGMQLDKSINGLQMLAAAIERHQLATKELEHMRVTVEPTCQAMENMWAESKRLSRCLPLKDNEKRDEVKVRELRAELAELIAQAETRGQELEHCQLLIGQLTELTALQSWLQSTLQLLEAVKLNQDKIGRSLLFAQRAVRRNKLQIAEIDARRGEWQGLERKSAKLLEQIPASKGALSGYLDQHLQRQLISMAKDWIQLDRRLGERTLLLNDCYESAQFYAESEDAAAWLAEKTKLLKELPEVSSEAKLEEVYAACGANQNETQAQLGLVNNLEKELQVFEKSDVQKLGQIVRLMTEESNDQELDPDTMSSAEKEQLSADSVLNLPRVIVLHDYTACDPRQRDLNVRRGELLLLTHKSNEQWWRVRRNNREASEAWTQVCQMYERALNESLPSSEVKSRQNQLMADLEGFVPASYLREVTTSSCTGEKISTLTRRLSRRKANTLHFDKANLINQQRQLENNYTSLVDNVRDRKQLLQEVLELHQNLAAVHELQHFLSQEPANDRVQKMDHLLSRISTGTCRHDLLKQSLKQNRFSRHFQSLLDPVTRQLASLQTSLAAFSDRQENDETLLASIAGMELFFGERFAHLQAIQTELGNDLRANAALIREHNNALLEADSIAVKMDQLRYRVSDKNGPEVKQKVQRLEELSKKLKQSLSDRERKLEEWGLNLRKRGLQEEIVLELRILTDAMHGLDVIALASGPGSRRDTHDRRTTRYTLMNLQSVELLEAKKSKVLELGERLAALKLKLDTPELQAEFVQPLLALERDLDAKSRQLDYSLKAQSLFKQCNVVSANLESLLTRVNSHNGARADGRRRTLADIKIAVVKDLDRLEALRHDINLMKFDPNTYGDVFEGLSRADGLSSALQEAILQAEEATKENEQKMQHQLQLDDFSDDLDKLENRLAVVKMTDSLDRRKSGLGRVVKQVQQLDSDLVQMQKSSPQNMLELAKLKMRLDQLKSSVQEAQDELMRREVEQRKQARLANLERQVSALEKEVQKEQPSQFGQQDQLLKIRTLAKILSKLEDDTGKAQQLMQRLQKLDKKEERSSGRLDEAVGLEDKEWVNTRIFEQEQETTKMNSPLIPVSQVDKQLKMNLSLQKRADLTPEQKIRLTANEEKLNALLDKIKESESRKQQLAEMQNCAKALAEIESRILQSPVHGLNDIDQKLQVRDYII
ncbi:hypothetical protein Ciccas_001792 [Cichlidogyrus casuarinus]|uniref:SH3 domain-containing protein n=1 Tax=Cichlidogyrus casuarinus TaxID=1844966 RepID=A0ABD2QM72_9PLAT